MPLRNFPFLLFFLLVLQFVEARSARFRVMWNDDPATTMVIGWDQVAGEKPILLYDTKDYGRTSSGYQFSKAPDRVVQAKGMANHFVFLSGLEPNTEYFFVVKDSDGHSQRYAFQTASNRPGDPISIIAGGDSRNHREARRKANQLVSKLRPHFVLFSGDMTDGDQSQEWIEWFDDWQLTFGSDGRIFPIIATRGNHEATNATVTNLFAVPHPQVYYDLAFGGDLLKIYTLNSNIPSGGDQKVWLAKDLAISDHYTWRFAQYHAAMRPHSMKKPEKTNLILDWATLFHKYRIQLAIESDAHVVKWTYPIKPSRASGSQDGFIRDDENGTVYIGEGCWGAPLRAADDPKVWTRDLGKFNQFKWIFIDQEKVEIRTLQTDQADLVKEVSHFNPFEMPIGIENILWKPQNGSVLTIRNPSFKPQVTYNAKKDQPTPPQKTLKLLRPNPQNGNLILNYQLRNTTDVFIVLLDNVQNEVNRYRLADQKPGAYNQSINFSKISPGQYFIHIEAQGKIIAQYQVEK